MMVGKDCFKGSTAAAARCFCLVLLTGLLLALALSGSAQAAPLATGAADCTGSPPNLAVDYKYTYWASLPDYLLRRLSVITTLKNSGAATAYDVRVVGGSASDGVSTVTAFPIEIGTFAPNQSRGFKIVYQLPLLLLSDFDTVTAASAADGCGSVYPYSYQTTNQITLMPPLLPL